MFGVKIYKHGQGKYSRGLGLVGIGGLALFGCISLHEALLFGEFKSVLWTVPGVDIQITPALLIMVLTALIVAGALFWLNNRQKVVDFLIDTEGELRKVAWPARDEVVGSSVVVMVTVAMMGLFIFVSDLVLKKIMHDIIYHIKLGS